MLDQSIELRGYPLDLLPLHDMTAGMYAVRIDTVDNVVAEMDRVTVRDVLLARCAYSAHEGQSADSVRSWKARAQRGLDFFADHTKHRRYAGDITDVRIPSEKSLDLFCLFSAPHLLSDAYCFFPALPFLFLVLSNPRFERVEFITLR